MNIHHWNNSALIELEINGERIVVKGKEVIEAINNCMNTVRY